MWDSLGVQCDDLRCCCKLYNITDVDGCRVSIASIRLCDSVCVSVRTTA